MSREPGFLERMAERAYQRGRRDETLAACEAIIAAVKEEREKTVAILEGLKRGEIYGQGCWCEHAIGNPMVQEHSRACIAAREYVGRDR